VNEKKNYKENFEIKMQGRFNVENVFVEVAKELYIQHEDIKNRLSRSGSISLLEYNKEENNNKYNLENEDEENRQKKVCCF
jgi:UDP-N-acetylmuramyl pentapeptide synthase